jgi:hypothetical protein
MTTNADGSAQGAQASTEGEAAPALGTAPITLGDETTTAPASEATPPVEGGAPTAVTYEPTGDAGLDMALGFLGNLGFDPSDPAMVAAADGDFAMLSAKLAAMGSKATGWEQYVALGKQSYAAVAEKAKATAAAERAVIEGAVGGAENWAAIQTWAKENAEPQERVAVNAALKAGGIAAKAMATYLGSLYERSTGVTVEGKPAVNPNATGGSAGSVALSPRAYVTAVQELRGKLGGNFESSPQYQQLQARRNAWRG